MFSRGFVKFTWVPSLLIIVLLSAFCIAAAPSVVSAACIQGLPSGSYCQTCNCPVPTGTILSCSCKRYNGNYKDTSIPYGNCTIGIDNRDGTLMCKGSFEKTCKNIVWGSERVTAKCKDKKGKWSNPHSIDYDSCRHPIANCDGSLTCERYGSCKDKP